MPFDQLINRVNRAIDATPSKEARRRKTVPFGILLGREQAPTEVEALIYEPIVCVTLQGEKTMTIGDHTRVLSAGDCIVVSHDLPILTRVTKASAEEPYLVVVIRIDLEVLRDLHAEVDHLGLDDTGPSAMAVAPIDLTIANVVDRYLDLIGDPVGGRVLLPLVRKEFHFRLLLSESGAVLRSLIHRDSNESNVARAIKTLREDRRKTWEVADLAQSVGMSTSAFHKHFKALTMTTPLQYQKDLRLTEARNLLRAGPYSVSSTAFEVGYESPSQFSREYARKFGKPPSVDLRRSK